MATLRSGYTTGACAAAAAKAATLILLGKPSPEQVDIPFPDGERHSFFLHTCGLEGDTARASVIKDAGDDPDVTNGAEIIAVVSKNTAEKTAKNDELVAIRAGSGVGIVTKPGLPIAQGEPAINPVPQQMIRQAVAEVMSLVTLVSQDISLSLVVTISVRNGEELAKNTLNQRLGIIGGLSILGTTGIVRPVSAKAWTDTIDTSMRVARAAGLDQVILATGRTSEAAVQKLVRLPEEAQIMMGDYLQHALNEAGKQGFIKVHLAGMWAKILKCALCIPQTHVRNGALEIKQAADLLGTLGLERESVISLRTANTAREILQRLQGQGREDVIEAVCYAAQQYAEQCSGLPVSIYLVTSEQGVIEQV
ncbi:MAG: cobalt-precorrin-5B (C(1))-methyltransferase [Candidatus Electrothrix sp. AW1]|nr:cobalt-precorrin-5B (C(1))-methyltransferase [Candidatus Electrothrix sp. AX1]MCI5181267.1 cobalt-precorrin-5B (C(1))-methyltransferase [Candidatus Electrothrix gigas]